MSCMGTYIVSTAGVHKSFPDLRVERARPGDRPDLEHDGDSNENVKKAIGLHCNEQNNNFASA